MTMHRSSPLRPAARIALLLTVLHTATPFPAAAQTSCDIDWSPVVAVSEDSSVATLPSIVVAGDTVHVSWFGLDTTAGGALERAGLLYARSVDGGASFSVPLPLLSPFRSLPGRLAAGDGRVFVASGAILDTFFGTVLFSSADGGATFSGPSPVLSSAYPEVLFLDGGSLYLGYREIKTSWFGLLRSDDGGGTWSPVASRIRELGDVVVAGGRFHAVGPAPGASRTEVGYSMSPDSGRNWFGPRLISPEDLVRSAAARIALLDERNLYSAWVDTGAVVFRFSRNGGISWGAWNRLSSDPGAVTVDIASDSEFVMVVWDRDLAGTRGVRGRLSSDRGETFCADFFTAGSPGAREPALAVRDSGAHLVWIDEGGSIGGVYYRRGSLPRNPAAGGSPPSTYALLQSWPNPVNGLARIAFDLPEPARASISLYDVLGALVWEMPAREYPAGRHVEAVDVGGLASGVYFYRLSAPGFTQVRTLVVLR